tara:strand:+ start:1439 stop:2800 length:1362 start_codon:yes stop_codon:yes gene_type:complete
MPNKYNISYSDIVELFTSASNDNLSVATFDSGTIDFLDANAVNKNYPYIYLRPVSSPGVVDKVRTLTFELYSMDVPTLADQSPVDTVSECEERIYQLMSWFNRGPTPRQQIWDITMTDLSPVNEAFQDRVFGWVATIEVASPWNWDYCDYPQVVTPTPSPTASPTPPPSPTTSPTPSPSPTTSPTPTASPTATPTPTPTPTPAFLSFDIDDTPSPVNNTTGSCNNLGSFNDVAYVSFTPSGSYPLNALGKSIYSDSSLTTFDNEFGAGVNNYIGINSSSLSAATLVVSRADFSDDNVVVGARLCSGHAPTGSNTVCLEYGNFQQPKTDCDDAFESSGSICFEVTCHDMAFPGNIVNSFAYTDSTLTTKHIFGPTYTGLDYWIRVRSGSAGNYTYGNLEIVDTDNSGSGVVEEARLCLTDPGITPVREFKFPNDMNYPPGFTGSLSPNICLQYS